MDKPFGLIIEDEREIAALFRHVLDMAGYQTEVISHGNAAIRRLSNTEPDLIILDLRLPEVSGGEILKIIRADRRLDQAQVVVVSAHAYMVQTLTVEPDYTLFKPISIEHFTKIIEKIKLSNKALKTTPIDENPWFKDTGIYNQHFFMNRLKSVIMRSKESDQYLYAILLMKFHLVKDQVDIDPQLQQYVFREIAESIKNTVRPTDTIASFDQDNVYILIENVPNAEIPKRIANQIQPNINEDIEDIEKIMHLPVRIGILLCDNTYEKSEVILREVEAAYRKATDLGDE